jgi:hypothetical protein
MQYTAIVTCLNTTEEGVGNNVDTNDEDQVGEHISHKAATQVNLLHI